jgi:hypothetical protein
MFKYNDGGRVDAGYKGKTGDCGARALAIATGGDYKWAYKLIADTNKDFGYAKSARNGVHKTVYAHVLEKLGFRWQSAPKFEGRKALCSDMPKGTVIARQAHHFVAVVDGIPQDTWDSSHKMVYGFWVK